MLRTRQQDYISKILDKLWKDDGAGSTGLLFFQGSGTLPEYIVSQALARDGDAQSLAPSVTRVDFSGEGFDPPFHPFLSAVRPIIAEEKSPSPPRFVEEAGIYLVQRSLFSSWLSGESASREEDLILEEYSYERERMLESLRLLLERASRKRSILILVEGLERCEASTARFINYLLDKKLPPRIKLIAAFSGRNRPARPVLSAGAAAAEETDEVEALLNRLQLENLSIDLPPEDAAVGHPSADRGRDPGLPAGRDGASLLRSCRDALAFLAVKECIAWSGRLQAAHAESLVALDEDSQALLAETLGDALYLSGLSDAALIQYQSLLPGAQKRGKGLAAAYRRIGAVNFRKDNVEGGHQYALQAMKLAEEADEEMELFRSYFLLFTIEDRTRKQDPERWRKFFRRMIELAKKLGQENALACYYTNPYGLYSQYTRENMRQHVQGQRIARKRGNLFRQATAWQTLGLVYSVKGKYDKVLKCYRKSEELKLQLGNRIELCYINNGLGFYEYMTGNYPEADRRYHRALEYLRTLHDYHETVMTLFNMASNRFFAFYHAEAAQILENVLRIIRMFDMKVLAYHSLFGMYCLLAVAYVKAGNVGRAYEYLSRIEYGELKPYAGKNEEYFLYELLLALLAEQDGRHTDSEAFFARARDYLSRDNDMILYMAPRFYWEWGRALKARGERKAASGVMAEGVSWAEKLGNPLYRKAFDLEASDAAYDPRIDRFDPLVVDFTTLFEFVRLEKNLNLLHRKNAEINFLNTLQSVLGEHSRRETLVDRVMRLINANFIMEHCHFFSRTEMLGSATREGGYARWSCEFTLSPRNSFDARGLAAELAEGGRPRLLDRKEDLPEFEAFAPMLNTIICVPLVSGDVLKGAFLCATEREDLALSPDDLSVLSIACRQFLAALDKLEHEEEIVRKNAELSEANQKLEVMADTDLLTGLYNRQALNRRLDEEGKRLARINPAIRPGLALCFMDLDNFKYFNDTYGHTAGDTILREFGVLLKKQAREIDYAARYGGDEFVLILPETGREGAIHLVARLLKALEGAESFRKEMEAATGKAIDIPEGFELSCSIGIYAYPPEGVIEPEKALRLADEALYQAKSQGKGGYVVASNK